MISSSSKITMLLLVALMVATTTEGQSTPTCASKLVPCAPYLNSTKPPPACCDPLKEAVTNDLDCLCKLFNTPNLLSSLGINVTQALQLPKYCNIPGDISACNKAGAPSSGTTPATPASKDNNGVSRNAWTGLSSLFMLCASVMLA